MCDTGGIMASQASNGCDDIEGQLEFRVRSLEKERDQLKANNERLRDVLMQRDGGVHDSDCDIKYGRKFCTCLHNETIKLLKEAKEQSLAEIQSKAVEEYGEHISQEKNVLTPEAYAQKLRE